MLMLLSILTFAQTKVVTGKVVDPQGQPVPFATVRIKGARGGVSADADGNFSIKATSAQTLVITGAGIVLKETPVGEGTALVIQVTRQSSNLDEVVVTALGVKRSRNSLPYAAQQISGDEVNKTITTNVVNNLSGKIAGLQITASNAMGGASNVILRGWRSLTQSNQALFIIDGVPYDNSTTTGGGYDFGNATQDLNPDDIASISALKGAAASALYGTRGNNGVILVTTKRGSDRKTQGVYASFGVGVGSPDPSTLPSYQTQYGEGYDATTNGFISEIVPWANGGTSPITIAPTPDDAGTGPIYDPSELIYQWDAFSPTNANFHKATPWAPAPHHNPTDYFVTPTTTTESVLVLGGDEKASFKFGYTRDDEKGYIPNSSIKKNLFDLLGTYNFSKRVSIEAGLNFANTDATNRYLYQYTAASNPMTDFRQWWPTNLNIKELKNDYFTSGTNATWNWQDNGSYQNNSLNNIGRPAYHDNPYWFSYHNPEDDNRNRYTGHVRGTIALTDWLSVAGTVSDDYYSSLIEQRADIGSQAPSFYSRQNSSFSERNYNLIFNVNKNLGTDFNLKGLLGGNIQDDEITSIFATTTGGLVVPGFWSISNSLNSPAAPIETDQKKEINSAFAGATLSWKNMVTLDGTVRRDQSSTLPKSNNAFYYPSVSGNFVFSKLMPDVQWLSYGKVYANYAQVGGDAPYYSVYNSYILNTPLNGQAVINANTVLPNSQLVPESNHTWEAGLELNFLNNRIGLDADYYHEISNHEILPTNVSQATGYVSYSVNGGEIQNQGIEATLDLVPVKTRKFIWDMKINWSKNYNKVLSLYGGQSSYAVATLQNSIQIVAEVGKPYGIIRGTDYKYLNGQKVVTDAGYWEQNANPLSDIGSIQPSWIGGVENSFTLGQWTLGFLIDFHQGGSVYSLDMDYGSFSGLYPRTAGFNDLGNPVRAPLANGGGIILKGVTEDGKANTTRIEENLGDGSYTFGSLGSGAETNRQFVYNASYIKLREAGITYAIPQKTLEGLHSIKGIDLSLSGRNLLIIHKDEPYADPEQGQSAGNGSVGFQNGAYPSMRTLNFILKVKF